MIHFKKEGTFEIIQSKKEETKHRSELESSLYSGRVKLL